MRRSCGGFRRSCEGGSRNGHVKKDDGARWAASVEAGAFPTEIPREREQGAV